MWWKLSGLAIGTLLLCLSIVPIRTHAILYTPMKEQPPLKPSLNDMASNMYMTPGTALAIVVILLLAAAFAAVIVRSEQRKQRSRRS